MTAPPTKTEPSSAYSTSPFRLMATVVSKAVLALVDLLTGVHQQEAAGAVGVLGVAGGKAALPEQGRLLVAGNAGHRNIHTLDVGVAVDLAGIPHLGQDAAGDVQCLKQLFVPVQRADVEEHRAAGVGDGRSHGPRRPSASRPARCPRCRTAAPRPRPFPARPPHCPGST